MSAAHKPQNCPTCGKALPMWRKEYQYFGVTLRKVEVGKQPAYRKYAPFCTLRCALWYARCTHSRYGHMFKKESK